MFMLRLNCVFALDTPVLLYTCLYLPLNIKYPARSNKFIPKNHMKIKCVEKCNMTYAGFDLIVWFESPVKLK